MNEGLDVSSGMVEDDDKDDEDNEDYDDGDNGKDDEKGPGYDNYLTKTTKTVDSEPPSQHASPDVPEHRMVAQPRHISDTNSDVSLFHPPHLATCMYPMMRPDA